MKPTAKTRHLPSLDGLRACAIALVIVAHLSDTTSAPLKIPVRIFGDLGNLGVRIFFVLSGFLITYLLLGEYERTGRISMRKFYVRRILRIFPAFYVFVGAMIVANYLGIIVLPERDQIAAATFTTNFIEGRSWYLGHTWSLAVEEQFYLLWPALFLLAGKRSRLTVVGVAIVAAPLARILVWRAFPAWQSGIGEIFPTIMDTIAVGAALAILRPWLHARRWYQGALASAWIYLLPALIIAVNSFDARFSWPGWLVGESTLNLMIAFGIDRALTRPNGTIGRLLNLRWVSWIGTLSYSLYLWQQPFMAHPSKFALHHLPYNILFTLACALGSFYLVERPAIRLKERIGRIAPAVSQ